MAETTKVFAISGSLRKGSFNRLALRTAIELTPPGMTIDHYENLADIPPYNDDVREKGYPPVVEDLRKRIKAADAILFVTPEYNYSVPGVLKNAIDWASRPPEPPLDSKPCAIMGASMGVLGSARAQYHLRQMCVFLNMFPINRPEVMIAQAHSKFDAQGKLTDDQARQLIADLLKNLAAWVQRLKK